MRRRVAVMVDRYVRLHFRSGARMVELFFWPTMELLLWGFFTLYLQREMTSAGARVMTALLAGMVFWDVLYRSQQSVSLALMEELWSRNVLNLLISPLRSWEWVASVCLYGLLKTAVVGGFLVAAAWALYAFDAAALGLYYVPFLIELLIMGWAMGLMTAGLLLRWGYAAEALVWGVPFLIQPFSAIFYPLSVYPAWLRPVCLALPSTHVMEGMRGVLETGAVSWQHLAAASALNALYLAAGAWYASRMLENGRRSGQLVRLTS